MRPLTILILLAALLPAQAAVDANIQRDYERALELAAAPSEGGELSEEEAKERAERFKDALDGFVTSWEPRSEQLREGLLVLARGLAIAGKPDRAVVQFRAFISRNPTSERMEEALLELGTALLDTEDFASAASQLSSFIAGFPSSERRHVAEYYLAVARYRLGESAAAIELLKKLVESGRESPLIADANLKYVEFLEQSGRIDEARAHVEVMIAKSPEATYLQALREQLSWIGKPAPELVGIDTWINGSSTTLSAQQGRVVVMNFFADRYEACQAELEWLAGQQPRLGGRGVVFLGITKFYRPLDKVPAERQVEMMRTFLGEREVRFVVGMARDFQNLRNYDVRGVPHTVVIGKDGRVVHVKHGASRKNTERSQALVKAIERALAR